MSRNRAVRRVPQPAAHATKVVLAVATPDPEHETLDRLAGLDPALTAHLRAAPLRILPLARRTEDLHAIALDRLAAVGIALGREPFGLSPEAALLLVEHDWTGDDLELDDVLCRAALELVRAGQPLEARGPRIEASVLRAVIHPTAPLETRRS